MASWLNHVAISTSRNGTSSHTVDPSSTGTVVHGNAFTPAAGRLLVCCAEGAVTSTTPTGWTLPSGGSAINNSGLYVWWIEAAGGDTFSTTHNGSDYPVIFDIYEFQFGSTFLGSAAATGVAYNGGAGPTLSGLTDTHWDAGVAGQATSHDNGPWTYTWDLGVEQADHSENLVVTSGYTYSLTSVEDATGSSAAFAATSTYGAATVERLVFAVAVADDPVEGEGPLWRARVYVA